jgi:hypothetical protein
MSRSIQFLALIVILGLFLAACGSGAAPTSAPLTPEEPLEIEAQPAPSATPQDVSEHIRIALAQKLGLNPDDVQIHSIDQSDWPDSCLGVTAPGEVCSQVTTPGYGGIAIAEGIPYEFHSDTSGDQVRFIPGAALAARQVLAAQLGIDLKKVTISSVEAVSWGDDCLGIGLPDQECLGGDVSGYRVVLVTQDGDRYEYHTDEAGGDIRLAQAPPAQLDQMLIKWSQSTEAGCQSASFGEDRLAFGACGGAQIVTTYLTSTLTSELHHFVDKYAAFSADTPAGKIELAGIGQVTATSVDQRMAAEWARLASLEASGGGSGAAWGLVFAWHREGGFAGFCDDVAVYLNGIAAGTSCKGEQPKSMGESWLTANQMRTIYTWVDTYQDYDYASADPAVADGMSMRMIFTGNGNQQMNEFEQTRLISLAQEVLGELRATPDLAGMEAARVVLVKYLSALTSGDYTQAAALYGGDYQVLRDNNPDVAPDDYAALFQAGCAYNGFVCNLVIKNFVDDSQLSPDDFRFTVELQNPDGTLFVLGPCCGADPDSEPPWTQFDFLVKRTDSGYLVQDLPIYVP